MNTTILITLCIFLYYSIIETIGDSKKKMDKYDKIGMMLANICKIALAVISIVFQSLIMFR